MTPGDSVMRRALDYYTNPTPEVQSVCADYRDAYTRAFARATLEENGVVLVGHPTLLRYALSAAYERAAEALKPHLEGEPAKKRGRPPVDSITTQLYFAAHGLFHQEGVSIAEAARRAAKFLGAPATKDRIEKARIRWLEFARQMRDGTGDDGITRRFLAAIVSSIRADLARIAAELEADRSAEAARRYSSRHASFSA